ncbi:MAG: molybdopterin-dependent oxidoreductase [Nitriliruptor sp.]|uniref:molybdopterin-dependent oxidoreductase n=1 Tax=Nitriliruptor sp. TaxID=2448056 RepID=UPI0034A00B13
MTAEILRLLRRADDAWKSAPNLPEPEVAYERIARWLEDARDLLDDVDDPGERAELATRIARRHADLDIAAIGDALEPSPGVRHAPTRIAETAGDGGVDPARVPPGQHLTPGWPVLHVGAAPVDPSPDRWRLTVTGRVQQRHVLTLADLRAELPIVRSTSDLHCVTTWSRLDNLWEGVRVADVIALAGARDEATHLVASGHPAYSASLDLVAATADDVLLAWGHDGVPLAVAHGGPLRLVVPARYGWKSVKWVTELKLTERDVPGYWEERGYHDVGDPWREQRLQDL